MSIYDFYSMKKRRLSLCKTPNGGRSASTLGKLKKTSEQLTSTVDSSIEVYWDNNSPSPTTTLALGKRRRRRQNNRGDENNETTDISFVVQKLSENTSPVVNHPRSTLLEMWVNKEQHGDDCDEEFNSPPNETRHDKRKAVLATPLNQRRTSKRTTRKATKQFMLEIRKLVDEIQKNDISSSGSLSQRDSQKGKQQEQLKRPELDEETHSTTTNAKPSTLPKTPTHTTTTPEPVTADPEGRAEDSFEWTEDDMDELFLTCQLSSSGKGSLDVPDAPRPHFGLSPSLILTHVPETQIVMLSRDQEAAAGKPRDSHESREDKSWEMNFGEDDSILESAAQEFELSQKSPSNGFSTKTLPDDKIPRINVSPAQSGRPTRTSSPDRRFPKGNDKNPKMSSSVATSSVSRVPTAAKCHQDSGQKNAHKSSHGTKSLDKSNENRHRSPDSEAPSNSRGNRTAVAPLNSRNGNTREVKGFQMKLQKNVGTPSLRQGPSLSTSLAAKDRTQAGRCDSKSVSSDKIGTLPKDIQCLLSGDNIAALFEDFNFEESLNVSTCKAPQAAPVANTARKASGNSDRSSTSSSETKKATYSKDEIERKRLEAQQRRLAKLRATSSRATTRKAKMR